MSTASGVLIWQGMITVTNRIDNRKSIWTCVRNADKTYALYKPYLFLDKTKTFHSTNWKHPFAGDENENAYDSDYSTLRRKNPNASTHFDVINTRLRSIFPWTSIFCHSFWSVSQSGSNQWHCLFEKNYYACQAIDAKTVLRLVIFKLRWQSVNTQNPECNSVT